MRNVGGIMAVNKKLIGFDEDLMQEVEKYQGEIRESFTGAVRKLIEAGLNAVYASEDTSQESEPNTPDMATIDSIERRIAQLEKDFSWWTADDTQSKVSDLENKLNVLTKVSKYFKEHLNNREIHLQD